MSNTIKAKLKNSTSDLKEAGDVYIFEGAGDSGYYMQFVCPCGNCNGHDSIPISMDINFANKSNHRWHWNGSYHKPSLKPSILRMSGCHWHGYLTEGEFREC